MRKGVYCTSAWSPWPGIHFQCQLAITESIGYLGPSNSPGSLKIMLYIENEG